MAKMSKADKQVVKDEAAAEVAFQKEVKGAASKQKAAPPQANGYYVPLGGGQHKFVPTSVATKPKE